MSAVEGFRASVQQLRQWQLGAGAALLRVDLAAGTEPQALKQALARAVERHEILRTRLREVPALQWPVQVIAEPADFRWREVDASRTGVEQQVIDELRASALDPAQPAVAAALLQRAAAAPQLVLAVPAASADALTLRLLAREIAAGADDEPLQYADFAQWQHELQASGDAADAGRAFWQRQLDAAPTQARHPFERRRAAASALVEAARELPAAQVDRLLTAAGGMGTSPATLLFACWAALLQRHLDTPELVVGWLHDGRNDATRNAFGPYALVLPLRVGADDGRSLASLARAHDGLLADALSWHDSLASTTGEPLSFGFAFEQPQAVAPGWRVAELRAPVQPFALCLRATHEGRSLRVVVEADGARFSAQAAACLLDQLVTLVASACEQSDRPPRQISSFSTAERARLQALQQAGPTPPAPALLHQLFERQAIEQPQAIALEFATESLSYQDLNRRANRVAHRLRRAGVRAEQPVGLYIGRSLEAMVGMLAILKAGGAYLPLDPAYPRERLAHMLDDSGAAIVLTTAALADTLPPSTAAAMRIDDDAHALANDDDNPVATVNADNLAYLIYTSGSTGRPKGVMVSHRNAVHSTAARWAGYAQRCEAFLLLSSISFDSSVAGLFWTLSQGGRLCLPADAQLLELDALAGLIDKHRITHTLMLPSLYAQLLESQAHARLQSLRCVIVAGEACPPALAARHHAACPQAALYNEYGPTEGSVWCTVYRSAGEEEGAVLPIGSAIAGMQVHVLDGELQPVPPGIAGEIVIGGAGIVRGYLRRPGLTVERFMPDPFGAPGARLYRTGDIGRLGADGCIEFVGRIDHQVKIRGFRVELGEIEAMLAEHAQVREAAVIARAPQGGEGDLRLLAYVVPRSGALQPDTLREHLKTRLPEHMLPSAIVALDRLPLTPNGKLDRAALPEPQPARRAHVPPRDELQALLAQIWADLLGVERVGLDDDFFELGGHSLVATQLVSRVRALLGREVAVRAVFQHPRLEDFAAHVAGTQAPPALPPIEPAPHGGPRPLSFAQQRLWFFERLHPGSTTYLVHDSVRLRGALDVQAMRRSLDTLVQRHEVLRTTFAIDDGQPVQRVHAARPLALPLIGLEHVDAAEREAEARRLLDEEARAPFDLGQGPLLRAGLVRLDAQEHVLWLTMHHVVSDGWSMRVLVRELTQLYEGFARGRPVALPPLPLQYADFAHWQRQHADRLQPQLEFWRRHLGERHPVLRLPGMRPRPALQSHRGAQWQQALDAALVQRIDAFCRRHGATRFIVMLAAFKALLAVRSGEADVRVGVPIANRHRLELEGLVGFFVNTLALRSEVDLGAGFATLVAQVRETMLAAHAHQDLPFEQLVQALQPPRDPAVSPLFQAMFDLHRGRVLAQDRVGGLTLEPMAGAPARSTMFDLMLDVTEHDDGLQAIFTYATDLFDEGSVAALARDYALLLDAATAEPEAPLSRFAGEQRAATPAGGADPLAEVVAAAQAVLGVQTLDARAGFFDQGGSSLQAVAWVERLNRLWSADIPLQLAFLHPTLAGFAAAVQPYAGART